MPILETLVDVLAVTHSLFHHDMRFGYERRLCARSGRWRFEVKSANGWSPCPIRASSSGYSGCS